MRYSFLLIVVAAFPVVASAHDDLVAFSPESQMIGELKRLDRGRLYFKTDATDQIPIDWEHVTAIVSKQQLQIELISGSRFLGHLVFSDPGTITIQTDGGSHSVPLLDVVRITPIEETIQERFDVDLSVGYNFTKASNVRSLNFGLSLDYNTEQRRNFLDSSFVTTKDSDNQETTRWNMDFGSRRLRENRWFTGYIGTLEQNDGLGVDLRTSLGIGGGRYFWQTNSYSLGFIAGLLVSRENIEGSSGSQSTIEGLVAAEYELFRFDEPEVDISTKLKIIPSLTDIGRVRVEYDLKLRWEIVKDLFWEVKFYDSFDSDPRSDNAEKNDYGIVTGIAWDLY